MECYSNKRMMFRRGGRFRKAPSLQELGFEINDREQTCTKCGNKWFPIVVNSKCPECNEQLAREAV